VSKAAWVVWCGGSASSSSRQPVIKQLGDQVPGDRTVAAGELRHEPFRITVTGQGDRRQPQTRGPSLRPLVQQGHASLGQRDTRDVEQLSGLPAGETQLCRADLG
jgi:hypothetical protein